MTAKIIWTLIFFCSIRGVYANVAKRNCLYSSIYSYAVFLHVHAGRSFGVLPPGFIEQLF